MRRIMRNALVVVALVVVVLLALGAVPSLLGSGDYYYLEVTATDDDGSAIDAAELSENRYPFLMSALAADDGRSAGYQRGPGEFKEWFTHSPFDELDSFSQLNENATRDDGDRAIVDFQGERYSVEIVRVSEGEVDD